MRTAAAPEKAMADSSITRFSGGLKSAKEVKWELTNFGLNF